MKVTNKGKEKNKELLLDMHKTIIIKRKIKNA